MKPVFFIFMLLLFSKAANSQQETKHENLAVVRLHLPAKKKTLFNYWSENNFIRKIDLGNPSQNDSVITWTVNLLRPTHFTRGLISKSPVTNKWVTNIDNFLLLPGDTLSLFQEGDELKFVSFSGGATQLKEIFWMPTTYDSEFEEFEKYKRGEYNLGLDLSNRTTLKRIQDSNAKSLQRIESLYAQKVLSDRYYTALKKFNALNTYNNIAIYSTIYPELKQTYREPCEKINQWSGISSRMNNNVLNFVFSQLSTQDSSKTLWDNFTTLPSHLKSEQLIVDFLLYRIQGDSMSKNKESLKNLLDKLIASGFSSKEVISYYESFIETDKLKSSTEAILINAKGDSLSFKKLLSSHKGRFVFVDIWASWCTPCFGEMPYLIKAQEQLKNENIVFIALSADKNSQQLDWLAAAKKLGLSDESPGYRFLKGFDNDYLKINNITAIPRYLLFDLQGKIIDGDFVKPSSKIFMDRLLQHLKRK